MDAITKPTMEMAMYTTLGQMSIKATTDEKAAIQTTTLMLRRTTGLQKRRMTMLEALERA